MSFKMIHYVLIFVSIISVLGTETYGYNTAALNENDRNPTTPQRETESHEGQKKYDSYELVVQFLPLENGSLIIPTVEIMFKYPEEYNDVSNKNNNETKIETEKEEEEKTQNQSTPINNTVPSQPATLEKQQNLTSVDNSTTPILSPEDIINNRDVLQILKDFIADEFKKMKMNDDLQKRPRPKQTITVPPKYTEQPVTRTTTFPPKFRKQPETRTTTFSPKFRKPETRTTTFSPKSRKPQGTSNSPSSSASTFTDPFDPSCYFSTEINPDESVALESPQTKESFICMHCCPLQIYDQYYTDYVYYIDFENTDLMYCSKVSDSSCV